MLGICNGHVCSAGDDRVWGKTRPEGGECDWRPERVSPTAAPARATVRSQVLHRKMKWRTADDEEEREEQTPLKEAGDPPVPFYSSPPSAKELVVATISTEEQVPSHLKSYIHFQFSSFSGPLCQVGAHAAASLGLGGLARPVAAHHLHDVPPDPERRTSGLHIFFIIICHCCSSPSCACVRAVQVIADLETTEEMVAFTLSAYALMVGFCPLAWGPLSDRYGRRGVLLSCLFIFIVAAIIAGYLPSLS